MADLHNEPHPEPLPGAHVYVTRHLHRRGGCQVETLMAWLSGSDVTHLLACLQLKRVRVEDADTARRRIQFQAYLDDRAPGLVEGPLAKALVDWRPNLDPRPADERGAA